MHEQQHLSRMSFRGTGILACEFLGALATKVDELPGTLEQICVDLFVSEAFHRVAVS